MITFAQFLGGIAAAGVSKGITLSHFSTINYTASGLGNGQGLAIEMFTTSLLVFTVLMMAAEKHRACVALFHDFADLPWFVVLAPLGGTTMGRERDYPLTSC